MAIIDHLLHEKDLASAIVVSQQQPPMGVDGQVDCPPLSVVRPEGVERGDQEQRFILVTPGPFTKPGGRFKDIGRPTKPLKRKKIWPAAGAKSAKSDKDGNVVPTMKRRREAGSKCKVPTLTRPRKVQEELPGEFPNFTKHMLMSHVEKHYWLGVPSDFCKIYLPENDVEITLEDELGQSYLVKYLVRRKGLSGGWGTFAKKHSLKVGDAAVFRLVEPTKFKVYIIRANGTTSDDDKSKEGSDMIRDTSSAPNDDASKLACEAAVHLDDMRTPDEPETRFYGVTSFSDFDLILDSSVVNDHKLFPDHMRRVYYKLCCDRKVLLHRHLHKRITHTLVVGLIMQTISISEGINALSLASSCAREDLAALKKILRSLELIGMDVGFLRKNVDELLSLLALRYHRWYTRGTNRPSSIRAVQQ